MKIKKIRWEKHILLNKETIYVGRTASPLILYRIDKWRNGLWVSSVQSGLLTYDVRGAVTSTNRLNSAKEVCQMHLEENIKNLIDEE